MIDPIRQPIAFSPLARAYGRGVFCCGDPDIDAWFWKKSWRDHQALKARVTTAHLPDGTLVGLCALSIAVERTSELSHDHQRARSYGSYFPCLEFQYLGVCSKHQGKGIGTIIIGRVVDTFADMAMNCGMPMLTLRAANDRVYKFYRNLGFAPYGRAGDRRLLLDAQSAITVRVGTAPDARG